MLFMLYQMTFAVITVALVAGSIADRMRFSAFVWFAAIGFWSSMSRSRIGSGAVVSSPPRPTSLARSNFAGGLVVHLNAGIAGLVAALIIGKRHGYGNENFSPYDLSLAVIGTGLLWVGWFGFNGGSALGAQLTRRVCDYGNASGGPAPAALTWMLLEWSQRGKPSVRGMISGAVAGLGTITPRIRLCAAVAWSGDRSSCRRHLLLGCTKLNKHWDMTIHSTCSESMASAA